MAQLSSMPFSFPVLPVAVIWVLIALFTAFQQLVLGHFGAIGQGALPSSYVLLALWALATPFVLQSATRWPVTRERPWIAILRHAALAAAFILVTNLVIRIPALINDPVELLASTAHGLATYGGYALLTYGTIVAIGHAAKPESERPTPPQPVQPAPSETSSSSHAHSLVVRENDVTRVIPVSTVAWVAADDNYVRIHSAGETVRARLRLAEVERMLPSERFVRVHRSAIVALRDVRAVVPRVHGDWTVELHSGPEFPVARGRRKALEHGLAALARS